MLDAIGINYSIRCIDSIEPVLEFVSETVVNLLDRRCGNMDLTLEYSNSTEIVMNIVVFGNVFIVLIVIIICRENFYDNFVD